MTRLNLSRKKSTSGWSLIELSVVAGIVVVLVSMIAPMMNKANLAATKTKDLANLRQMATAVLTYAGEHNNTLPGPVYRGVKYPTAITPNTASERQKWLSTLLIDQNYCDSQNTIWKSPSTYGANTADISYILNNTDYSIPQNFFGDRSGSTKGSETLMTLFASKDTSHGGTGQRDLLSQIWMASNADGQNYDFAASGKSSFAVPSSLRTPWNGRNYVFFDGHGEFRSAKNYPANYPSVN